jgi:uncharacterized membrane protein
MRLTRTKIALFFLALAGFFDSGYLAALEYKHVLPPCSLVKGCETVLTSRFARLFDIPLGVYGALFFLTLILILLMENEQNGFYKYFKLLIFAGIAVSFILLYLQAFVLHAFCQYCLLIEALVFAIFALHHHPFNSSSK